MADRTITKTTMGYEWDSQGVFTWIMVYNDKGEYTGQWQSDVEGEGDIFLYPEMIDGVPCVNGMPVAPLTEDEMRSAA